MIPLDDEVLMRRIDGELTPDEAARVDAAASADPAVAARLAALAGTGATAKAAFPIGQDARDADLARLIRSAPDKASPPERLVAMLVEAFAPRRAAIWGGLATVAFVGGLALGHLLAGRSERSMVASGGVLTDAGLVRVLETRLAADGPDSQGHAVGLTFRDVDGRWCRTFNVADASVSGLACRQDGQWELQVLAPLIAGESSGDLRMAGAQTPGVVLIAVDAVIAGQTLDRDAETTVRDAGWPSRE